MADFSVKVEGLKEAQALLKKYPQRAEEEFDKAIIASIIAVDRESKKRSPVDTGRMRSSIQHRKIDALTGEVKTGVNYAIYVHEGTRYMSGRPFLREAIDSLQNFITENFKRAMGRIFQ